MAWDMQVGPCKRWDSWASAASLTAQKMGVLRS